MLVRSKTWPVVILVCLVAVPGRCAAPVDDTVRDDWYFRESLSAIRDWEAILDRWEKTTPEAKRTPSLPVPGDGATAGLHKITGDITQMAAQIPALFETLSGMPLSELFAKVRLIGDKALKTEDKPRGAA